MFACGYVVGVAEPAKLGPINRFIRELRAPLPISSPRFRYLPGEADVVMLGDSITAGTQWHELLPNVKVINRGANGDTVQSVYLRLGEVIQRRPQKIFVMAGINDLRAGRSRSDILRDYRALLSATKRHGIKLYVQSVLCVAATAEDAHLNPEILVLNEELRALCAETSVTYVDLLPVLCPGGTLDPQLTFDGLHLNGHGYLIWAQAVQRVLVSSVPSTHR